MLAKNLLEKLTRNFTIRINCRLFSSEIAKQHRIYQSGANRCLSSIFRLSYLQIALNAYSMVATLRFLLLSLLLAKGAEDRMYSVDVLMAAFDAKRNYDQYITFCTAAFVSFIVYIYYLNYFCLNQALVGAIWATVQKAKIICSSGGSSNSNSNNSFKSRLTKQKSITAEKRKKWSAVQVFFKFEAVIHSLLMVLFGKLLFSERV